MQARDLKYRYPRLVLFPLILISLISCNQKDRFDDFSVFRDCDACPEMVVIPPGTFIMGSNYEDRKDELILDQSKGWNLRDVRGHYLPENNTDEEPAQKVKIDYRFAIGKYVVTKSQFEAYVRETGVEVHGCTIPVEGSLSFVDSVNWQNPYFPTSDFHPVVCISWLDSQKYLEWLSRKTGKIYRLPSEAEWEYVSKAGTNTTRFFGNDRDSICAYGNVFDLTAYNYRLENGMNVNHRIPFKCDDGHYEIAPVNRPGLLPNPWGVYEMFGNVFEMVQDRFHMTRQGAPLDGSAWEKGDLPYRIGKGGGYSTVPAYTRPGYKGDLEEDFKLFYLSFRVVRELE